MKKILRKLIICVIVYVTISNLLTALFTSNLKVSLATDASSNNTAENTSGEAIETMDQEEDNLFDRMYDTFLGGGVLGLVDGITGLLSKFIQVPFLLIGLSLQMIFSALAKLGGNDIEGLLTPDDIIFNRLSITDINFFDINNNNSDIINTIRTNIATWYYVFRIFSIVVLLAVLIYIGIRMTISTVASDQAQYKRMLKDWAVSFALLFFLNYIIIFTLEANNAFVSILAGQKESTGQVGRARILNVVPIGEGVTTNLVTMILTGGATKSWGAFVVYFGLLGMTAAYFFMYVKRMLTIGFLIIISPLITITYSIDRVGDSKAQAMNTWLREFMVAVLIQPFHCLIYIVFVSTIIGTMRDTGASLSKLLLAVVCMSFVWQAEKIIKEIFGLHDKTGIGDAIGAWATVKAAAGAATKLGGAAGSAIANTQFGQNISNRAGAGARRVANSINNSSNAVIRTLGRTTGKIGGAVARHGTPIAAGVAAASMEMGAGTPANAAHVGFEAYDVAHTLMFGKPGSDGSAQAINAAQKNLSKTVDSLSRNNYHRFNQNGSSAANKAAMKTYAQSLISANLDNLERSITMTLSSLTSDPRFASTYDINTSAGQENIRRLQDLAYDENFDFRTAINPRTGTNVFDNKEKAVITAIQTRNFAKDLQALHKQHQAAGRNNPRQNVDDFLDKLNYNTIP